MTTPLAFLSYRRSDSGASAHALYAQLKVYFGSGQLFMDVNAIRPGHVWGAHLLEQVERASGMLVLIGERWLRAADHWGRRRIDDPDDWVVREISTALRRGTPIIPVLLDGIEIPPTAALPGEIARLFDFESCQLREGKPWVDDVAALARACVQRFELRERPELRAVVPATHDPEKARTRPVDEDVLSQFLARNAGWEVWEDALLREHPYERKELRKHFAFSSFAAAIDFMRVAADLFEREAHHPRWSNESGLVTVALTTWDAGNRITSYDLRVAVLVDDLYRTCPGALSANRSAHAGDR